MSEFLIGRVGKTRLPVRIAEASIVLLHLLSISTMSLFFRRIGLVVVVLFLAACDKPSDKTPAELTPPADSHQAHSAQPAEPTSQPVVEADQPDAPVQPAPATEKVSEPEQAKAANKPPFKPQSRSVTSKEPAEHEPLNLSLNPNVFDPLKPYDQDDTQPEKLLPPLFEEKPAPESPFQLNGKLITNDNIQGDYWDSVEGAQLNFEFKQ